MWSFYTDETLPTVMLSDEHDGDATTLVLGPEAQTHLGGPWFYLQLTIRPFDIPPWAW